CGVMTNTLRPSKQSSKESAHPGGGQSDADFPLVFHSALRITLHARGFRGRIAGDFPRRSASRVIWNAWRQPEVLDSQRPAGLAAPAGFAGSKARIGSSPPLV